MKWIDELGKILFEQGTDYSTLTELWKETKYHWTQDTHVVNLAMMLKSEAMASFKEFQMLLIGNSFLK